MEGFPGSSTDKASACNTADPNLIPGLGISPGEGTGYPLQYSSTSLGNQTIFSCNTGGLGLIPRLGRSPSGGHGNPLQYSCLENPHGQRSLAGYSPWDCRVGQSWATKHKTMHIIFAFFSLIINSLSINASFWTILPGN